MNELMPFSLHEIVGVKSLEFDIYNEAGNIIAYKSQTIDPSLAIRMQYMKLFRRINALTECDCFDNQLISKQNRALFINLLSKNNGLTIISSPEKASKEMLIDCIIANKNNSESTYIVSNSEFQSKFPINITKVDNKIANHVLTIMRSKVAEGKNTIIIDINFNVELLKFICENFAFNNQVIIVLNNPNSIEALSNIIKIFPDRVMLSYLLEGIIAQTSVPALCGCKTNYYPEQYELYSLFKKETLPKIKLFKPKGCNLCDNKGYFGVVQVQEVLIMTEEIKIMLKDCSGMEEIKEYALKKGFQSIQYDRLKKAACGLINLK